MVEENFKERKEEVKRLGCLPRSAKFNVFSQTYPPLTEGEDDDDGAPDNAGSGAAHKVVTVGSGSAHEGAGAYHNHVYVTQHASHAAESDRNWSAPPCLPSNFL